MAAVFAITEVVGSLGVTIPPIEIVDAGAMWGGEPPYAPLVRSGVGRVVGFEPVQSECDRLNSMNRQGERYLPYFIGDGTERTFYLTNRSMTASLYEPNMPLLRRFQQLDEVTRVVETPRVQTRRLDDIPEIESIDLLKADVQGAELDLLKGAERLLEGVQVIQLEVEFLPMYKGQPLFADIDIHLRARGFVLHSFVDLQGRCFRPVMVNNDPTKTWRQHLYADAVYVRDFMEWKKLSPERLLKTAAILHECFHSVDIAALALQHYQDRTGVRIWDRYITRLTGSLMPQTPLE